MITISGLGYADEAARDSGSTLPVDESMTFMSNWAQFVDQPKPGTCAPPDVMSEFGCLTPYVETGVQIVISGGQPVWGECPPGSVPATDGRDGICRSCPPGSEPYSAAYCLRANNVEAERIAAKAQADALAAAAAKAQADADAVAAAAAIQQASQAEAQRQQQYADMVAAAAKQAADAAVAAYALAHPDGTEPSPGMTVTPTNDATVPAWSVQDERKRWYKWGAIGAGVIGVGLLAALVARR